MTTSEALPCLLDWSRDELAARLAGWGAPAYRAAQIWDWLYRRLATAATDMRNLPAPLRARLAREVAVDPLAPRDTLDAADGQTRKTLFALRDGETIEAVRMRYERRHTLCVSTQVGCAMGCLFCATGQSGFTRDLTPGEIVAQVLYFARQRRAEERAVTNVVFMGMGEPLANYEATWKAIRILNHPDGFALGARRMTISTVGLVDGIRRMAAEPEQVALAISLHAPDDALRGRLVPVSRGQPLDALMAALDAYVAATRRRVTIEYALIDGVNDAVEQAERLARLLRGRLVHVNLIPLNATAGSPWQGSPPERVAPFQRTIERAGIAVTVRLRRGADIAAGCGQLRARHSHFGRQAANPAAGLAPRTQAGCLCHTAEVTQASCLCPRARGTQAGRRSADVQNANGQLRAPDCARARLDFGASGFRAGTPSILWSKKGESCKRVGLRVSE